jgi:hypothetical protein
MNMRTQDVLTLVALSASLGCSTVESEPRAQPADVGVEDSAPVSVRTLVERPLLATLPQNLLLDISFREAGWGHFTSFYEANYSQFTPAYRIYSLTPASVSAPTAIFRDPSGDDIKSRGIVSISSFLGGKAPFIARIWASCSNAAGDPIELGDDATVFRAAITTGGLPEGKAYDLARKDQRTIGGRTWVLLETRIDTELPNPSFFNLKFGKKGGGFMVTAPEVIALALLPAGDPQLSFERPARARALLPEEAGAIAAYVRQPHQLGLPKLPKLVPGKWHPLD